MMKLVTGLLFGALRLALAAQQDPVVAGESPLIALGLSPLNADTPCAWPACPACCDDKGSDFFHECMDPKTYVWQECEATGGAATVTASSDTGLAAAGTLAEDADIAAAISAVDDGTLQRLTAKVDEFAAGSSKLITTLPRHSP
eukprot:jgi/Ulvmu1/10739/UM068_0027.1